MLKILGDRRISLNREISKMYEEIYRGSISSVIKELGSDIKGEFVIIMEGNKEISDYTDITIEEHIKTYIHLGYSEKDAMKLVAKDRNMTKSDIYREYMRGK